MKMYRTTQKYRKNLDKIIKNKMKVITRILNKINLFGEKVCLLVMLGIMNCNVTEIKYQSQRNKTHFIE